jgi:hypothetical protein
VGGSWGQREKKKQVSNFVPEKENDVTVTASKSKQYSSEALGRTSPNKLYKQINTNNSVIHKQTTVIHKQ